MRRQDAEQTGATRLSCATPRLPAPRDQREEPGILADLREATLYLLPLRLSVFRAAGKFVHAVRSLANRSMVSQLWPRSFSSPSAVLYRVDFGRSLLFFPSRVQPIAASHTYYGGIVVSPTPFGAVTGIKMALGDTSASCTERLDAEHAGGRQI